MNRSKLLLLKKNVFKRPEALVPASVSVFALCCLVFVAVVFCTLALQVDLKLDPKPADPPVIQAIS